MEFVGFIILCLIIYWSVSSKNKNSDKNDPKLEPIPNKMVSSSYKTSENNDDKAIIQIDDLHVIVENFIRKTPAEYFLLPEYIGALDYCIVQKYKEYQLTFLQTCTKPKLRIANEETRNFFENDYDMFMQLVSKAYSNSSNLRIQKITYDLLKEGMIDYYSMAFENAYGSYFREWDHRQKIELRNIIFEYLEIESIVKDDPVLIGQLTCYTIRKYNVKRDYLTFYNMFISRLKPEVERLKLENFEKSLRVSSDNLQYSIDDIDLMGGLEFEQFIADLFSKMGYFAEVTKASGDQGIDVIAEKNGKKIGIQAKCYTGKVTNSAIQEVAAGLRHYKLDKGMVITNSWFTSSAHELSKSNNIILWDRNRLKEKLAEITF